MSKHCAYEPCEKPSRVQGLCDAHYRQRWLGQDLHPLGGSALTLEQRFWGKVRKGDGCWEWEGSKDSKGYGQIRVGKRLVPAHRLAFEWSHGTIPDGLLVDHLCHNPGCVNVAHCRLATNGQNQMNKLGAHSHSKSGIRGVWWNEKKKRWNAEARLDGRKHHIGMYKTIEEADEAARQWRRENMPYSLMDKQPATAGFFNDKITEHITSHITKENTK